MQMQILRIIFNVFLIEYMNVEPSAMESWLHKQNGMKNKTNGIL